MTASGRGTPSRDPSGAPTRSTATLRSRCPSHRHSRQARRPKMRRPHPQEREKAPLRAGRDIRHTHAPLQSRAQPDPVLRPDRRASTQARTLQGHLHLQSRHRHGDQELHAQLQDRRPLSPSLKPGGYTISRRHSKGPFVPGPDAVREARVPPKEQDRPVGSAPHPQRRCRADRTSRGAPVGGGLSHRRRHAEVRAPVLRPDGLSRPARPPPRLANAASQPQDADEAHRRVTTGSGRERKSMQRFRHPTGLLLGTISCRARRA